MGQQPRMGMAQPQGGMAPQQGMMGGAPPQPQHQQQQSANDPFGSLL